MIQFYIKQNCLIFYLYTKHLISITTKNTVLSLLKYIVKYLCEARASDFCINVDKQFSKTIESDKYPALTSTICILTFIYMHMKLYAILVILMTKIKTDSRKSKPVRQRD